MPQTKSVTERAAWKTLQAHAEKMRDQHLRDLFARDAERGERLTLQAAGLFLDPEEARLLREAERLTDDLPVVGIDRQDTLGHLGVEIDRQRPFARDDDRCRRGHRRGHRNRRRRRGADRDGSRQVARPIALAKSA